MGDEAELLRRQEALRDEARELLDAGLGDLLAGHGELWVGGSYALCLMVWRDLDLMVAPPVLDPDAFAALGPPLRALLEPVRMSFRDEVRGRTPGLPRGYYWGIRQADPETGWKLDVWAVEPADLESARERLALLQARIGPDERRTILRLKDALRTHPAFRRAFTSLDLYLAVLDDGVTGVDAFLAARGLEPLP